jgi:hypothetical protein
MELPLLIVQKIDAIKTFLLPTLDFRMIIGDVGEKQLMKMDQHICASANKILKVRGLPIECHHVSWRDGGLSCRSLVNRRKVLMMRSFAQMMMSTDMKTRETMKWFAESERQYRCIGEAADSAFLNWKDERGESWAASLIARTKKACAKTNVQLKLENNEMILTIPESECKTQTTVSVGPFLTQNIIRTGKITKLIVHGVRRASFTTLKDNEVSNAMMMNVYTRRLDTFFRFVVLGRADCLPTPVDLQPCR